VGQALHELAEHGQLLCVTHQPQVAAQADHHLQVVKQVIDGRAATRLVELDREARTQEVARMLGGTQISARALEHARELVARGAQSSRAAES
ncbi:MAG TPA: DNA repair protein RecN, partial [Pseudomonadales bacterium]|nr:DNA repair protein RecN [Pseudomonadales bacterium]